MTKNELKLIELVYQIGIYCGTVTEGDASLSIDCEFTEDLVVVTFYGYYNRRIVNKRTLTFSYEQIMYIDWESLLKVFHRTEEEVLILSSL